MRTKFDRLAKWIIVALVGTMTIVVWMQVFLRYVVKGSLPWSEELARYLMVWSACLAGSVALRQNAHAAVGYFRDLLPPSIRPWIWLATRLSLLTFASVMLYQGYVMAKYVAVQESPALLISMKYPYASVPVGFFLIILVVIADLPSNLGKCLHARSSQEPQDGHIQEV